MRQRRRARARLYDLLIVGIVLLIFGAALWLGDAILDPRRADECIASGQHKCAPMTVPAHPLRGESA
jgi:hypothetical protein